MASAPPTVEALVAETRPCLLRPAAFFVAWSGVLVVAFDGFPPPLEALKAALDAHHGPSLLAESPGSRWPKSTLGAVIDGERITPAQLETLHALCATHSAALCQAPLEVAQLQLVLLACRSLEAAVARTTLPLSGELDVCRPSEGAAAAAAATLAEFQPGHAYWRHASRDGSRTGHYREAARGATLVAPVPAACVAAWQLAAFRAAVDAALPGVYGWHSDASLHVTVRALL